MSKPRRRFTPEFKQEAVTLLRRSTKSQTQVAQELGIAQTTLSRWALQGDRMPIGARGFFATEELKVLRHEVERLRQERDILKKAVAFLCQGVIMRYQCIQAEKVHYPVQALCRVLGVARSGYYAWRGRPLSPRWQQNEQLVACIRRCHVASRERHGSPRIHKTSEGSASDSDMHQAVDQLHHSQTVQRETPFEYRS